MNLETHLTYNINEDLVDDSEKLSLIAILSLAQDVAIHAVREDLGISKEQTRDKGLLWVVARYHFEIKRLPSLNETVEILSHQSKTMVFFFIRHFEFFDEMENPLIEGVSAWALIDAKNRQLIMPKDHDISVPDFIKGNELKLPGRVVVLETDEKTKFVCEEKDLDVNKHMNNVVYLSKCVSLIPKDYLKTHTPKSFDVSYKKELRLGEETELNYSIRPNECSFDSKEFSLIIRFDEAM